MSDDGSEDSAPRPKRKIKRVVVMSSNSSSDSDECIAPTGTRRKRMRVVSDAETDTSGSSVVCAGARRKRTLPKLRDSDGDSDTSGWATDQSDAPKPAPGPSRPASGFASDSSEGNSDKCSICLMRFTSQEVGTPQNCEHIFCLDCITEWSKNVNTCPVDRLTFDSIVVRACAGGRVLRTEPVTVVERRPSVEMLVIEDPTTCEICGNAENEESMLLCDGCDLGFHMQCLTPPLTEIPAEQWLCPNCDSILDVIQLSEIEGLFSGLEDIDMPMPLLPRFREPRHIRGSSRNIVSDEPSTSSGSRGSSSNVDSAPSTSRGTRISRRGNTSAGTTRRRTNGPQRRKYKRRRTKAVIIEYEVEENGKIPITKRVKRRIKKPRSKKRQPRTVARRSHVRASVRARLADLRGAAERQERALPAGHQALAARRRAAAIPALSLFGARHQLDCFDDDDDAGASEAASTAVAVRPTAGVFSAYRQARRKMVSVPSPPHASSAPDLLSSILDSQAKLHSRNSVVSISVDGSVSIEVQTVKKDGPPVGKGDGRLDLTKGDEGAARKAPSYPGQSRGGWGGGYRGDYHREQAGGFGRAGAPRPDNGYGAGAQGGYGYRRGPQDGEGHGGFARRPHSYPQADDNGFDRNRRPPPGDANRQQNFPQNQRHDERRPGRPSLGPSWQPYGGPGPRRDAAPARLSCDDPLDMRVQPARAPPYRPLPEPPVFEFDKTPDVEKSEDERSDSGLVIDTEKYDPTEPTNDDDSGDDPAPAAAPGPAAALDASVLDVCVRQVLREHSSLLAPAAARSDDDSDGDCPNFSIYSAASVHIANDAGARPPAAPAPAPPDDMADLVQEDDEPAPPAAPAAPARPPADMRKTREELKEKVSKRCPITTNPRNPIKIKLNTPSLIRRHMSLYDDADEEEEPEDEAEPADRAAPAQEPRAPAGRAADDAPGERGLEARDRVEPDEDEETTKEDEIKNAQSPEENVSTDEPAPVAASESKSAAESESASEGEDDDDDDKDGARASPVPNAREASDEEKDERDAGKEPEPDDAGGSDAADKPDDDALSADARDASDGGSPPRARAPGAAVEKMTESISETEDERSYTPCLDENKSKDASLEPERDRGLDGLDTEMISEDEGNELFGDDAPAAPEDGEIPPAAEPARKKKRKDSKRDSRKEGKEKGKKSKKSDVAFKKLSKSGKERHYRDKDKDERRRDSSAERKRKRKEKRKDLERYDVRTVVTDKRRRAKDAFGRDVSPRRSRSPTPRSPEPRRTPEPRRRSPEPRRRSLSPRRRSPSPRRRSPSLRRRSPSPRPSPVRRAASPSPARRRRPVRRRSRPRKRRASASRSASRARPKGKRRRRARSERPQRRRSPKRRRGRRRSAAREPPQAAPASWSPLWAGSPRGSVERGLASPLARDTPGSVDSRLLSPRTPPPVPSPSPDTPRTPRRRHAAARHRHQRSNAAASKEVFTSGDNILVSVSFKVSHERCTVPFSNRLFYNLFLFFLIILNHYLTRPRLELDRRRRLDSVLGRTTAFGRFRISSWVPGAGAGARARRVAGALSAAAAAARGGGRGRAARGHHRPGALALPRADALAAQRHRAERQRARRRARAAAARRRAARRRRPAHAARPRHARRRRRRRRRRQAAPTAGGRRVGGGGGDGGDGGARAQHAARAAQLARRLRPLRAHALRLGLAGHGGARAAARAAARHHDAGGGAEDQPVRRRRHRPPPAVAHGEGHGAAAVHARRVAGAAARGARRAAARARAAAHRAARRAAQAVPGQALAHQERPDQADAGAAGAARGVGGGRLVAVLAGLVGLRRAVRAAAAPRRLRRAGRAAPRARAPRQGARQAQQEERKNASGREDRRGQPQDPGRPAQLRRRDASQEQVPEEAEPAGARGGGGEAGAEAALQQEARHQGPVQGHPAPRRAQDLSQQVGRDQPDQDPSAGGGVREEVPEKEQTRPGVARPVRFRGLL